MLFIVYIFPRKHSSLNGYTPYQVHHDSHISSTIARFNSGKEVDRQQAISKFHSGPSKRFTIGERVRLKKMRPSFYKTSAVFYPNFSEEIYTIQSINKRVLPWLYSLAEISNKKKRYYGFELLKIDSLYDSIPNEHEKDKIFVKNFELRGESTLRSGRLLPNKKKLFYHIVRNNKEDIVPAETLKVYPRIFGKNILVFSDVFDRLGNTIYKL